MEAFQILLSRGFSLVQMTAVISILTFAWLGVTSAPACQICLPFPTRSLTDDLIESEYIALAREDPDKPFTLKPVSFLKGDEPPVPLELFLDSQSRRLLANSPDLSIVCVYSGTSSPASWRRVALYDATFAPIISDILEHHSQWLADPIARATYFSAYLGHEDRQISSLAHLEVARAPYDTIRSLAGAIPTAELHRFIADIRMMEWQALYILFLAQSKDPSDHQRIEEAVHSNAKLSITLQTAAWATAYIEIKEADAIEYFDEHYLSNPDRSEDEIRAILAACSVHGTNGHTHLRARIIESYRNLMDSHPAMLPTLTADLEKWENWDLVEKVGTLLKSTPEAFDLASTIQLRKYLRSSPRSVIPSSGASEPSRLTLWLIIGLLLLLPAALKLLRPWHQG